MGGRLARARYKCLVATVEHIRKRTVLPLIVAHTGGRVETCPLSFYLALLAVHSASGRGSFGHTLLLTPIFTHRRHVTTNVPVEGRDTIDDKPDSEGINVGIAWSKAVSCSFRWEPPGELGCNAAHSINTTPLLQLMRYGRRTLFPSSDRSLTHFDQVC